MQEIAPHIFIETDYPGVTLGVMNWPQGLVLIDAPFRPDDIHAWRGVVLDHLTGVDRLMVNLDDHFDRTLGSRQFDCLVAGHEKMTQAFRDRPVTFKGQTIETGADWELHSNLGTTRWAPPEITFSEHLQIHWGDNPLLLQSHPGPAPCAAWAVLPVEKIVFVGDAVIPNAPPFIGSADFPLWIESLSLLLKPEYKNFQIVSGRGGLVLLSEVKNQLKTLDKMQKTLEKFLAVHPHGDDAEKAIHSILKQFDIPRAKEQQFVLRVHWGVSQYIRRHVETTPNPEI